MGSRTHLQLVLYYLAFSLSPLLSSHAICVVKEAAVNANSAPTYVLEESISDQLLWKETAGNRPPQPVEERAYFEAMWAKNFANSEVEYEMPTEVLTATTPLSLNPFDDGNFGTGGTGVIGAGVAAKQDVTDIVSSFVVPGGINASGHASGQQNSHLPNPHNKPSIVRNSSGRGNLTVYAKGDNVFGTTVSKSFARPSVNGELVMGVDTVNISVASYRVVEVRNSVYIDPFLFQFYEYLLSLRYDLLLMVDWMNTKFKFSHFWLTFRIDKITTI